MKRMWMPVVLLVCLLVMAGCSELTDMHEKESGAAQNTKATLTPAPSHTLAVTPEPQPMPMAREDARFSADLNGDGKDETIVVMSMYNVPNDGWETIYLETLENPDKKIVLSDFDWFSQAYLTYTQSGQPCVLVSCDGEGGEVITYICSFSDTTPILQNEMYEAVLDINGTDLTMGSWTETIGDWDYTRDYELTDEFELVPVSDMMIVTQGREPLVAIRELPVEMLDDGEYVKDTLPIDTIIWPVSADGNGHMTFRTENGRTVRITYTVDDEYGYALINGLSVDGFFDNIEYWGLTPTEDFRLNKQPVQRKCVARAVLQKNRYASVKRFTCDFKSSA